MRKSGYKKLTWTKTKPTWTKTKPTFSYAQFVKNSQPNVIKQKYNRPARVQKYQEQYLPRRSQIVFERILLNHQFFTKSNSKQKSDSDHFRG